MYLYLLTLGTNEFPTGFCLDLRITVMAETSALILYESRIRQFFLAELTPETVWMPGNVHRLNDPPNDKLLTKGTTGCEEDVEILKKNNI